MKTRTLHLETAAVHAGRADLTALGVHAPPIDFSSTNPLPDVEHGGDSYESMAGGGHPLPGGGRGLWAALESHRRPVRAGARRTGARRGRGRVRVRNGGHDRGDPLDHRTHRTAPHRGRPSPVRRHRSPARDRPLGHRDHLLPRGRGGGQHARRHGTGRSRDPGEPDPRAGRHRRGGRSGRGRAGGRRQHLRDPRAAEPARPRRCAARPSTSGGTAT